MSIVQPSLLPHRDLTLEDTLGKLTPSVRALMEHWLSVLLVSLSLSTLF